MLLVGIYFVVAFPSVLTAPADITVLAISLVVGAQLIWLSAIDLATKRLPDRLTYGVCAIGLLLAAFEGSEAVAWSALAGLAGYALFAGLAAAFLQMRSYAGLGLGDAKLLAAGGTLVGLEGLGSVVLIGSMSALVFACVKFSRHRQAVWTARIPFGPFLAIGIWCVWHHGPLLL
ncbi:MAG: A24 family peptidase [Alphaproteobacteria bacterium]|nr:A24 family peptidase [Alphaproteobacteria bacterium]